MAQPTTWRARQISFMHRVHARRAARANATTSFANEPEPRSIGVFARGEQLVAGKFLFSGLLVDNPSLSIWDIAEQNKIVAAEIHSSAWLDDLAALGNERARHRAQQWVFDWITRYGAGTGPGWVPDLVGRRLIRWISHGEFLLRGRDQAATDLFFQTLARQMLFLSRRWKTTPAGLPRFEALSGTIYAGLSLRGMEKHVDRAVAALAADCQTQIDPSGAVASRNPEELLEVLTLLNETVEALERTKRKIPRQITDAITQIVPTLRALRHADGSLARFHGGGAGLEGRADQALAASGVKTPPAPGLHMGFARLTGGRTSLIVDAATPPQGDVSGNAHASTLGFEMTSGRRPVIVNCGSGARFGDDWRRAGRATPSHTTLGIDGASSSHLATANRLVSSAELLVEVPTEVRANTAEDRRLELSHNGYQPSHGLTHARILQMSVDGRRIEGEDLLATLVDADEAVFSKVMEHTQPKGIAYTLRFHLHPDVTPAMDPASSIVSLTLKSGEVWEFRHDGTAELALAHSVYLQNGQLRPRTAQQVVLTGRAMAYATRVRWSLAKAHSTPTAVRDLVQAD